MESESNCFSLDSSVILRFIMLDNPFQLRRAKKMLLSGGEYYVDDVAVMECVYVMTKQGYDRQSIADELQEFLANPMIHYSADFFAPIFETYVSHPSLSFDDLVLAARAEKTGRIPLWTFDKKFAHQSKIAQLVPAA